MRCNCEMFPHCTGGKGCKLKRRVEIFTEFWQQDHEATGKDLHHLGLNAGTSAILALRAATIYELLVRTQKTRLLPKHFPNIVLSPARLSQAIM